MCILFHYNNSLHSYFLYLFFLNNLLHKAVESKVWKQTSGPSSDKLSIVLWFTTQQMTGEDSMVSESKEALERERNKMRSTFPRHSLLTNQRLVQHAKKCKENYQWNLSLESHAFCYLLFLLFVDVFVARPGIDQDKEKNNLKNDQDSCNRCLTVRPWAPFLSFQSLDHQSSVLSAGLG